MILPRIRGSRIRPRQIVGPVALLERDCVHFAVCGAGALCRHASFVDGVDLFDNKLFGLSLAEVKGGALSARFTLGTSGFVLLCPEAWTLVSAWSWKSPMMLFTGRPQRVCKPRSGSPALSWTVVKERHEEEHVDQFHLWYVRRCPDYTQDPSASETSVA